MTEPRSSETTALGASVRDGTGITVIEIVAAVLTVLWIVVVAALLAAAPDAGAGSRAAALAALAVPVSAIWMGAVTLRAGRAMREDSRRLRIALEAMRKSDLAERQARSAAGTRPEKLLDEIAQTTRLTQAVLLRATGDGVAEARPGPSADGDQPALALEPPDRNAPVALPHADLIRALNFPDTADDAQGFAALRRALRDGRERHLVQASQDVLTLLSQDGIYMDDLQPDRARPEIWRRFAKGERSGVTAALGGIRDPDCLGRAGLRMREDTIFRDAAHHFLRRFDQMLARFEQTATDSELAALAETRTARAFMLLGRVAGIFDASGQPADHGRRGAEAE